MQDIKEEELGLRRLKISEFILGILVGIIGSVFVEALIILFKPERNGAVNLIGVSIFFLIVLFILYKRIIGYPDYVEYDCKFLKNENFNWKSFRLNFSNSINENLRKNGFFWLKIWTYKFMPLFDKLLGYTRAEIRRTKFGSPKVYVYLYSKEHRFKFLICVPNFSDNDKKIISSLKETMNDLLVMKIIKKDWKFSDPKYYHSSWFSPIKKKGKELRTQSNQSQPSIHT